MTGIHPASRSSHSTESAGGLDLAGAAVDAGINRSVDAQLLVLSDEAGVVGVGCGAGGRCRGPFGKPGKPRCGPWPSYGPGRSKRTGPWRSVPPNAAAPIPTPAPSSASAATIEMPTTAALRCGAIHGVFGGRGIGANGSGAG